MNDDAEYWDWIFECIQSIETDAKAAFDEFYSLLSELEEREMPNGFAGLLQGKILKQSIEKVTGKPFGDGQRLGDSSNGE